MSETKIKIDKTGHPIPEAIIPDWIEAESNQDWIATLQSFHKRLEFELEEKNFLFCEVHSSAVADLSNVISSLKCALPYAVCPFCQGRQIEKCTLCTKRGFISKFRWDHCVPEELKAIRAKGKKK